MLVMSQASLWCIQECATSNTKMAKVLVIGSGGREHAIAWAFSKSSQVEKVYVAPGNSGMEDVAQLVDIKANDFDGLISFVKENNIDLTFVGPEDPLVGGIVDKFEANNLKIFGPRANAAIVEGSKAFSKEPYFNATS